MIISLNLCVRGQWPTPFDPLIIPITSNTKFSFKMIFSSHELIITRAIIVQSERILTLSSPLQIIPEINVHSYIFVGQ